MGLKWHYQSSITATEPAPTRLAVADWPQAMAAAWWQHAGVGPAKQASVRINAAPLLVTPLTCPRLLPLAPPLHSAAPISPAHRHSSAATAHHRCSSTDQFISAIVATP